MTATERLRELLDERGVKWGETRDGATAYSDESGHVRWAIACGAAKCFFEVGPLTPEQAIAATLGCGTCHDAAGKQMAFFACSACGATDECKNPKFCHECGRKVVGE